MSDEKPIQPELEAPPAAPLRITLDAPTPDPSHEAGVRPPVVRITRRHLWMAGGALVGLIGFGVLLVSVMLPRLLTAPDGSAPTPDAATGAADARRIQATLFYVSDDGTDLVPVTQAVLYGATPLDQARRIVEAAVAPPPDGQVSAIPADTTVRAVFIAGPHAYVDLGGAIASGHSGGTMNEALAVYAIVNAITVNLPDITAVQILVDGRQMDTLVGHLDLRYPLGKALDWVRKGQ